MLKHAIERVIDDPSYHLNVEPATAALQQAKCVHSWSTQEGNKKMFDDFEVRMVEELRSCVPCVPVRVKSFINVRTEICRKYHILRTSAAFIARWSEFLRTATDAQPQPTFYQEVTDIVFENIISSALPLADSTVSDPASITYDDTNVINYAAGYVCRKIHNNVAHSSNPEKAELMRCIEGLLKAKDDEGEESSSAEWVNEVDRGGLWHVEEGTCMLFAAMEEEVREHFQVGGMEVGKRYRQRLIDAVCNNEDVLFHWCMLTAESEETHAQTVFEMLVSMWITVRGFAFASGFVEMYKQQRKKGLQRSKALRKNIIESSL